MLEMRCCNIQMVTGILLEHTEVTHECQIQVLEHETRDPFW